MTVAFLIGLLRTMPQDAVVVVRVVDDNLYHSLRPEEVKLDRESNVVVLEHVS